MELRVATDDDVPAIVGLLQAADDARVISVESGRHARATRPEHARLLELVAVDGGRVVGTGIAGLNIWTTTPGASWAFVTVAADRRREGMGSALAERLREHLGELGATRVTTFIRHTDEGERWANARGFERVITGPLIAVDPRTVPEPELPDGFRWAHLSELEPEAFFEVVRETTLDEPSAEPNDNFDFHEFLREWNDPILDRGASAAVLHGDEVVAFSFVKVAGGRAQHGFTGCARAYRGRGLATAAKRAALRALAGRGITRVTTSNAEQNAAMRAINRRLGFEPIGEHVILARDL